MRTPTPAQIASHAEMVLAYRLGYEAAQTGVFGRNEVNPFTLGEWATHLSKCWKYGNKQGKECPDDDFEAFARHLLESILK